MKMLISNLKIFIFLILLTGLVYPLLVTWGAMTFFRYEASGSLLIKNKQILGSLLIAQNFTEDQYFWARPSAINYDASLSGASQLGPTSKILSEQIATRARVFKLDPSGRDGLLFASGSGLDPDIDPSSAYVQLERVAMSRQMDSIKKTELKKMLDSLIEKRNLGVFGKDRINVLKLNLLVDERFEKRHNE